jgi:F-type H+-transporting ATPase subunit gamma
MAGTKEIKQRIKSVKSTKKITKAMELVAASKMKRAISQTIASRLYAHYSWDLLTALSNQLDKITHPFFIENTNGENKILFVLITSNTGLCGAYNSQILKKSIMMIKDIKNEDINLITVGKKGDGAIRRIGLNIIASFTEIPDNTTINDINPLSKLIIDEYKSGKYKNVYVAYTDFISALNQKANIRKLLPITKQEIKELIENIGKNNIENKLENESKTQYLFEGNYNEIIESLTEKLVRMQIYQMILESGASEQSSRMIAMKNASEAAGEMIEDLTLIFNKARQANITQEISEISAGMASIN